MPLDLTDKVFLLGPCIDNGGTYSILEDHDLIPISANIFSQWVANAKEVTRQYTRTRPMYDPVYQTGLIRRHFAGSAPAVMPPTLSAFTVLGETFLQNNAYVPHFSDYAFGSVADFTPFVFMIHNKQFFLQCPTPASLSEIQFVSITDTVFVRQRSETYSTVEGSATDVQTETFTITDTYF